jgi:hypothetical protein
MMFKTIAVATAITLSTVSVQAKDYLDGVYTGGPGPSDRAGKRISKKPHSAWVWEDTGCGNNCPQPDAPKNRVTGYSFNLLTIRHSPGSSFNTVKSEPFGVYASMQECNMARATKVAELDAANQRQPHYLPNAPMVSSTTVSSNWNYFGFGRMSRANDQITSTTSQTPLGPTENMNVTFCEPGIYAPESTNNIAKRGITQ